MSVVPSAHPEMTKNMRAPKTKNRLPHQRDSTCPVVFEKIFRFCLYPNQTYNSRHPAPAERGVSRSSRTLARDAVDATVPTDERRGADGEVVWFRRPDAGVKLAAMLSHRGLRWWQKSPVTRKSAK
jgi:hypothetical protein